MKNREEELLSLSPLLFQTVLEESDLDGCLKLLLLDWLENVPERPCLLSPLEGLPVGGGGHVDDGERGLA